MPPKKDVDTEELLRQKFHTKCRFRALGRYVLANRHWLIEGVDEYTGDDVKRRVEQAVRVKKKKQLLNINDKALLNKNAKERTFQEQQYLSRILGGLKCFKRYPNNVKKKLAAVTYFKYYGPNRVVVRQHQEAHALYFIVTGDVIVSQLVYDELLQQYFSVDVGTMTAGDMFGEVSLLHNIPRTATVTTNGHCEFLALMKDDFKNVLQASVQQQWDKVRLAMSSFTYFDALDEVARREGCIVAKMKTYARNETLLGDGVGVPNFVYFILSGRCQMIESLQVTVTTRLGRNYYTLYDPYVPKEESEQDFDKKWFSAYQNKPSDVDKESKEAIENISELVGSKCSKLHGVLKHIQPESKPEKTRSVTLMDTSSPNGSGSAAADDSRVLLQPQSEAVGRQSVRLSVCQPKDSLKETFNPRLTPSKPANLRTYFMQVVKFNPGSTFGFGENMRDRRIIALTPVSCMLLPKVWLLQRNTANIWTRIQHFLEKKIPTKETLFKEFVSSRRWHEYREQLVSDVIARSNTVNFTTVHDVPYSIRMDEMVDI